jgi:putative FmdB family regulatory protein
LVLAPKIYYATILPRACLSVKIGGLQNLKLHNEVKMPIYEYQCSACGHTLEALQKMSEDPLKTCPACHKDSLGKLVSATSFQLKGTGWYATDFKTKPQAPASTTTDTKEKASTDTKPASDSSTAKDKTSE